MCIRDRATTAAAASLAVVAGFASLARSAQSNTFTTCTQIYVCVRTGVPQGSPLHNTHVCLRAGCSGRHLVHHPIAEDVRVVRGVAQSCGRVGERMAARKTLHPIVKPVSYTHLTLPTICSV
eukprot:479045-Alexandrium_andersonii.AAC.1